MELSYFHSARDFPKGFVPEYAVVTDVLRATTTISCALENGAEAIETFADVDNLIKRSQEWPSFSRLLLGERGGKKIEGFDLGNSPVQVVPEIVKGKRLFMSTTNGTRSLHVVQTAGCLYTLALPNRRAVAEKLLSVEPRQLCIVGSGWEGAYSLEDSLAAGALISFLLDHSSKGIHVVNDEVIAALSIWKVWQNDLEGCLRKATHGKRLESLGNHDEDFKCCARLDNLYVVPTQIEPGVLSAA